MLGGPVHDMTLHEVVEVTCRVPLASVEVVGLTEPDVTIRDSDEAAASAAQAPLPAVGGRVGELALELPAARVACVAVAAVGKRGPTRPQDRLRAQAVAWPSAGENGVPRRRLNRGHAGADVRRAQRVDAEALRDDAHARSHQPQVYAHVLGRIVPIHLNQHDLEARRADGLQHLFLSPLHIQAEEGDVVRQRGVARQVGEPFARHGLSAVEAVALGAPPLVLVLFSHLSGFAAELLPFDRDLHGLVLVAITCTHRRVELGRVGARRRGLRPARE
eukprot:scaffold12204_cov61-Phaeocystis_antarctica.AAC.17